MKKIIVIMMISSLVAGTNLVGITVDAKQPEGIREAEKEAYEDRSDSSREAEERDVMDEAQVLEKVNEEEKVADSVDEKEISVDTEEIEVRDDVIETIVPIYNYEIENVVVPTTYAMSLNPYEMPIVIDEDNVSTDQVVSRNYGVINKSSTDKIVTITFTVEDLNNNKIVFVDSEEEAKNADEDIYAVYLSVIPADEEMIRVGGMDADTNTQSSALSDVEMVGAKEQAIALHSGENHVTFKLSKAVYDFGDIALETGEKPEGNSEEVLDLISLNPDGKSVTAFTFDGAMNQKAEWEKLLKGVKITAAYDYRTADGTEKVIDGTGAMIAVN